MEQQNSKTASEIVGYCLSETELDYRCRDCMTEAEYLKTCEAVKGENMNPLVLEAGQWVRTHRIYAAMVRVAPREYYQCVKCGKHLDVDGRPDVYPCQYCGQPLPGGKMVSYDLWSKINYEEAIMESDPTCTHHPGDATAGHARVSPGIRMHCKNAKMLKPLETGPLGLPNVPNRGFLIINEADLYRPSNRPGGAYTRRQSTN